MDQRICSIIVSVFSILCLVGNSSENDVQLNSKSSRNLKEQIPLVTSGAKLSALDLLSIQQHGSMVGIEGGHKTNISEHPYQIAVDTDKNFVCSGALLNRIWAITLATCFDGAIASRLTVRAGSDHNLFGGTVFNVTDIQVHPQFNSTTRDYDFAMLKLNTFICYDRKTTNIDFSTMEPEKGYLSVLSGWGTNKELKGHVYRELNMTVGKRKKCKESYSYTGDIITERMFCAASNKKGPCSNDFGDPLVINGTLYGLFSWSRGCALEQYPAVFSNIARVTKWIHQVMNDACVCGVL